MAMRRSRIVSAVVFLLCALLGFAFLGACRRGSGSERIAAQERKPAAGSLEYHALKAKAQGRTETQVSWLVEPGEYLTADLKTLLEHESLLVVTLASHEMAQTQSASRVWTWSTLNVQQVLHRVGPVTGCMQPPAAVNLKSDLVALPLQHGSVKIGDVTVHVRSNEEGVQFKPGIEYLVVAVLCSNGVVFLPDNSFDVMPIQDGTIQPSTHVVGVQFVDELVKLGTIRRVSEFSRAEAR
jgi:hypothetical protein